MLQVVTNLVPMVGNVFFFLATMFSEKVAKLVTSAEFKHDLVYLFDNLAIIS